MGATDSGHQEKKGLLDYRKLNAVIRQDQFPMPRIDEGLISWRDPNTSLLPDRIRY